MGDVPTLFNFRWALFLVGRWWAHCDWQVDVIADVANTGNGVLASDAMGGRVNCWAPHMLPTRHRSLVTAQPRKCQMRGVDMPWLLEELLLETHLAFAWRDVDVVEAKANVAELLVDTIVADVADALHDRQEALAVPVLAPIRDFAWVIRGWGIDSCFRGRGLRPVLEGEARCAEGMRFCEVLRLARSATFYTTGQAVCAEWCTRRLFGSNFGRALGAVLISVPVMTSCQRNWRVRLSPTP